VRLNNFKPLLVKLFFKQVLKKMKVIAYQMILQMSVLNKPEKINLFKIKVVHC
jgi:hypothetical protein